MNKEGLIILKGGLNQETKEIVNIKSKQVKIYKQVIILQRSHTERDKN